MNITKDSRGAGAQSRHKVVLALKRILLALIPLLLLLAACSRAPEDRLVGGTEVPAGEWEYLYFLVTEQARQEEGLDPALDTTLDGRPLEEALTARAEATVTAARRLEALAAELGCVLTAEDETLVPDGLEPWQERYGYRLPLLRERVTAVLFGPGGEFEPTAERMQAFIEEKTLYAQYLYLTLKEEDGLRLPEDECWRMIAIATALRKQAAEGADFTKLIAVHGQDFAMAQAPQGTFIFPELYSPDFAAAVRSLAVGELSGVLEADNGLFIVLRLDAPAESLETQLDALKAEYCYWVLEELLTVK